MSSSYGRSGARSRSGEQSKPRTATPPRVTSASRTSPGRFGEDQPYRLPADEQNFEKPWLSAKCAVAQPTSVAPSTCRRRAAVGDVGVAGTGGFRRRGEDASGRAGQGDHPRNASCRWGAWTRAKTGPASIRSHASNPRGIKPRISYTTDAENVSGHRRTSCPHEAAAQRAGAPGRGR